MHKSSYEEMSIFAAGLPDTTLKIADVGSYNVNGCYKPLFSNPKWNYIGLDRATGPNVDRVLDDDSIWNNVADKEFDVLVTGQTLEHVKRPWLFMKEAARIIRPGGLICAIAPYQWGYHEHPIDCWRMYPEAMKAIMEDAGLQIMSVHMNAIADTVGVAMKPNTPAFGYPEIMFNERLLHCNMVIK
jgi:SAM-dependent methyltransferase